MPDKGVARAGARWNRARKLSEKYLLGADKRPGLADPKTGAGKPDLMHIDLGGKAYPGRKGITTAYRALGVLPGVAYGHFSP